MTAREAEQKVRERYPNAVCRRMGCGRYAHYTIFANRKRQIGGNVRVGVIQVGRAAAWESAARRLTGEQ
jgi:hypothetical protein